MMQIEDKEGRVRPYIAARDILRSLETTESGQENKGPEIKGAKAARIIKAAPGPCVTRERHTWPYHILMCRRVSCGPSVRHGLADYCKERRPICRCVL
ncbi:unnamed protein product [Lasius platythorax]|uniref:Uncharacterized protein n=1 Tax=Lasius platythorax TaxID=488582 RepID=A0AAV2MXB5_9HYME